MRLPRMTTRRWMVAVAVIAVGCAVLASLIEMRRAFLIEMRRERFARIADRHLSVFLTPAQVRDPERCSAERLDWHSKMADKYMRAARYPWLPVEPDPPNPK
jgi:hypothetical protein